MYDQGDMTTKEYWQPSGLPCVKLANVYDNSQQAMKPKSLNHNHYW